jgi:DNA-binding MarR family transcriptional regulator
MNRKTDQDEVILGITDCLRRIIKSLQNYSQNVNSHFGITGPQLWVIKTIYQNGSLPLGELSKRMYLHPSTLTAAVDRLEKKGYVLRNRIEKDRRVINVQLTPKGIRLAKRAPKPIQGKMIYGLRKLEKYELSLIYRSVERLVEIMEAEKVKVTFLFDQEA